jgi:hypothetical protein
MSMRTDVLRRGHPIGCHARDRTGPAFAWDHGNRDFAPGRSGPQEAELADPGSAQLEEEPGQLLIPTRQEDELPMAPGQLKRRSPMAEVALKIVQDRVHEFAVLLPAGAIQR